MVKTNLKKGNLKKVLDGLEMVLKSEMGDKYKVREILNKVWGILQKSEVKEVEIYSYEVAPELNYSAGSISEYETNEEIQIIEIYVKDNLKELKELSEELNYELYNTVLKISEYIEF